MVFLGRDAGGYFLSFPNSVSRGELENGAGNRGNFSETYVRRSGGDGDESHEEAGQTGAGPRPHGDP